MSRRDLTYGGKNGADLTREALLDLLAYVLLEQSETPPRLALHQALIAQDVASVPQERAKSECAPPPGVTQERAATGTVERSTACDIVAQSLVRARETQKLARYLDRVIDATNKHLEELL